MSLLLRTLLHRVQLLAPAGEEGGGGGVAVEEPDDGAGEGEEGGEEEGQGEEVADGEDGGESTGEVVVSLGGDEDGGEEADEEAIDEALKEVPTANAAWGKLRIQKQKFKREALAREAEVRQLREQLAAAQPKPAVIDVGPKPKATDYDMYEPEQAAKFETDLLAWTDRKQQADAAAREQQEAQQAQQREWNERLQAVETAGTTLGVKDNSEALQTLGAILSVPQMGMLIDAAADPKSAALMRYALGTNPAKAKELAAIKNPVKFVAAIVRLESQVKVTPRKAAPAPDKRLQSGATGAPATGDQLERLRAKAAQSNDLTSVLAFKRQQRQKAKQAA